MLTKFVGGLAAVGILATTLIVAMRSSDDDAQVETSVGTESASSPSAVSVDLLAAHSAGECWLEIPHAWSLADLEDIPLEWVLVESTSSPQPEVGLTASMADAWAVLARQTKRSDLPEEMSYVRFDASVTDVLSEGAVPGLESSYTALGLDQTVMAQQLSDGRVLLLGVADTDDGDDRVVLFASLNERGHMTFHGACANQQLQQPMQRALDVADLAGDGRAGQAIFAEWVTKRTGPVAASLGERPEGLERPVWSSRHPKQRSFDDVDLPSEVKEQLVPVVVDVRLAPGQSADGVFCVYAESAWAGCSDFGLGPLSTYAVMGESLSIWHADETALSVYVDQRLELAQLADATPTAKPAGDEGLVWVVELSGPPSRSAIRGSVPSEASSVAVGCGDRNCAATLREVSDRSLASIRDMAEK